AVLGAVHIFRRDLEFVARLLLDGNETAAFSFLVPAVEAEDALRALADAADDARLVRIGFVFVLDLGEAGEHAVADAGGRLVIVALLARGVGRDDDQGRGL